MIYQFLQNNLILLLLFTTAFSLAGLFLYNDYMKKICCLSLSYLALILLFTIIFKNNDNANDLFSILITIFIIFLITLATGVGIISNISKIKAFGKKRKKVKKLTNKKLANTSN